MYIIVSKKLPASYYTGNSWSDNKGDAKQYASLISANSVIAKHRMTATAVEVNPVD